MLKMFRKSVSKLLQMAQGLKLPFAIWYLYVTEELLNFAYSYLLLSMW